MSNTYALLNRVIQSTIIRDNLANHLQLKDVSIKIKFNTVNDNGDSRNT